MPLPPCVPVDVQDAAARLVQVRKVLRDVGELVVVDNGAEGGEMGEHDLAVRRVKEQRPVKGHHVLEVPLLVPRRAIPIVTAEHKSLSPGQARDYVEPIAYLVSANVS